MGAESRVDIIEGPTLNQAFNTAQDQANFDYGHGYTGSIAEARGYRIHTRTPMLEWEAIREGGRLLDTDAVQKWGPAVVIPVATPTATRTITMTVDVTGDRHARSGYFDASSPAAITVAAIRRALRDGEGIVSVEQAKGDKQTKIVTTTTKGATKTVYRVKGDERQAWDYPTLAEAKAAAQRAMEKSWTSRFTITKVTMQESGEPLAVVERVVTKQTVNVTAVVGKPSQQAPTKWVAAGIYSS